MKESRLLRHLRSLPAWLIPVLAIFSTALLWMHDSALDRFTDNPQLWLGVIITVVLWILVLVTGAVSLRLRRVTRQFDTLRSRQEIEGADLALSDGSSGSPPGIRHLPAWLVLLIGLLTAGLVWYYDSSLLALTDEPRLWLGVAVSAVLWVMVMANAVNRFVARRAKSRLLASHRREALVLEMLQSLQVMISATSADGSRSRFNSYYQLFTGRSEDQLKGRGWLECIHPDDREQCIGTIVNHEPRRGEHLELEYTLVGSDGEHRWIREFLVPRFGADGSLLEYIASATDITAYVANETEHETLVEDLRKQAERLRGENVMVAEERDDLAKRIATAEREARDAKDVLAGASDQLDKALIEIKAVKSERTQLRSDNGRLNKSIEQLNQKLLDAEKARGRAEEQLNGVRKEVQQVSTELKTAIKEREASRAEAQRAGTDMAKLERTVQNIQAGEQTLREELQKARADLQAAGKQLAESRSDLERATSALGKLEQAAESFQATEQALRDEIKQGQEDVKAARHEQQATTAETKKMVASVPSLEKKIEALKASEQALKEQMEQDRDNQDKARTESTDARRKASHHRAKINRLTSRCKELEDQLAALGRDRDQLTGRAVAAEKSAAAQSGRRNEPASRGAASATGNGAGGGMNDELSTELRLALSSVARINEQLRDSSLDETQRTFIENAQASVDAMASLIDDAIGRTDQSPPRKDTLSVRAFDLRAAAKGVCDIVQPAAEHRGVGLRCNVDSAVPPLISTDPVRLRQVLMYLMNSAIRLVDGGEIGLRITADGITASHATMRFEIRHANARIDADQLEATFSLNREDAKGGSEPARKLAARAWQLISDMKGQFAFELPETGGFRIWFNLTLAKLVAANNHVEPEPPPRPSKLVDPASIPLSASAPAPEPRKAAPKSDGPSRPSSGDRTAPRLPQEMLDSNLGPVIELGADSVRVQCSKVPKGATKIDLLTGDGRLKLPAEVVSSDRIGVRKFSVVFRFSSVTTEQRRQIMQIVFAHRKGATMLPLDSRDGGSD